MLAVVLAAGSGRRLGPLTATRSKAMVPVAGKPIVERVLERLAAEGVGDHVVVARPDDEPLLDLLQRPRWRSCVRVVFQDVQRGMADAVDCAAPVVRKDGHAEFLLVSCDNILPEGHVARLIAFRRQRGLDAALTLVNVSEQELSSMAAVVMDGERVTRIVEKPAPGLAPSNMGSVACYSLSSRMLDYVPSVTLSPRGELEFPDTLRRLIEDGGAVGGLMATGRMTLTVPADLLAITSFFLDDDSDCAVVKANLPSSTVVIPPVRIDAGASVGSGCRIGPEVYLEKGCFVGEGVVIQKAVVLCGGEVPPGSDVLGLVVQARDQLSTLR